MPRSVLLLLVIAVAATGCGKKPTAGADGDPPKGAGPADGAAPSLPPAGDYSKGPGGEEIVRLVEGKERLAGFKDKKGKFVRHGTCSLHSGTADGPKLWEGDYEAGKRHGKLTGWYKDGTLWFERWFDKGKPVGTHKGYDAGKVVWELRFDAAGKPNVGEVDCFCVVSQVAFLYGTPTWDWTHPSNENATAYKFTNAAFPRIDAATFVSLLGQPHEVHARPKGILPFDELVFRCKDGTVRWVVMNDHGKLMADSLLRVSGRRKY